MISSLENNKIKLISKLDSAKHRRANQLFMVEGSHLVNEAKLAGVLVEAFSLEEKEGYTQVSEAVMRKICHTDTVVKEVGLCKFFESIEIGNKILILDGVQDPGNMGALMRSAKAFGFDTFFVGNGSVDIYNDKVIRSSQGAIFKLNFHFGDSVELINSLKGYDLYGTNVIRGIALENVIKKEKMAIILGNEGNGISDSVDALELPNIYIPMNNTESLNVAVAGSIIMYELR